MDQHRVYVYTDTFDDYHGDIRALTFCYSPRGSAASETLFTVEIRKPGSGVEESHDVIVNPAADSDFNQRTNCISGLLDWPYCCIEQTLAESISVNHNRWYALSVSGPASLLLRHLTAHANGEQTDLNGSPIAGTLYKPLFFFSIDSSDGKFDGNKNCMM